jgi:hypothetical protein
MDRGVLINGDGFLPMTFALIEAQRLRRRGGPQGWSLTSILRGG